MRVRVHEPREDSHGTSAVQFVFDPAAESRRSFRRGPDGYDQPVVDGDPTVADRRRCDGQHPRGPMDPNHWRTNSRGDELISCKTR
jgi:hypothetical protein